ncbi:MAG: ATP-binding protein [Anaerolineae bacterium]|jgi:signal transduction histidine kinase
MSRRWVSRAYVLAGLVTLATLLWRTIASPPSPLLLMPGLLFGILIVFADVFGVHLGGGVVSLLPMTTVAAYLVTGPLPTAWAAFVGALVHGELRYRWPNLLRLPPVGSRAELMPVVAANATAHTVSALASGAVLQGLGGRIPLTAVTLADLPALVLSALAYLAINHLVFLPIIAARGQEPLRHYLRSLPNLVAFEGGPLILAPLMALVYTRLGLAQFCIFALNLVAASLITRSLARTSRRLERRVQELSSLQVVGQALSASLDIDAVVAAIYDQVARLMAARNFYIALYDSELDEVAFPLAIEDGELVPWRSRRTGSGLTEYVLKTGESLLMRGDVPTKLGELGIGSIGRSPQCWLGVPILAAEGALGVIAVQSYEAPEAYDLSHAQVLSTIAAQAAVAIQNARLYARTDEALARRVQELDSILRSTREGILLLGTDWRIVAVNRALADLIGLAQLELYGSALDAPRSDGRQPLIGLLGYTSEDLRVDCQALADGLDARKRATITAGASKRHLERTLTPVRGPEDAIIGWLLVLRDVTEEIELAGLKDDLTHMLVHDLRSPLTVLGNSLIIMENAFAQRDSELFSELAAMARRSNERISTLVNDLLGISELESDQVELVLEVLDTRLLLQEAIGQLAPLASSASITITLTTEEDLPWLHADAGLIRRVLNNLLDNAIKFTPEGGCVRVWARHAGETEVDELLIGVSDEGPGIPQEEQRKVFEKFRRVRSVAGRRSGSGLGLPFCKLAVEAHGGRIWVQSPSPRSAGAGTGTTFVMALPVGPANPRA